MQELFLLEAGRGLVLIVKLIYINPLNLCAIYT